MPHPSDGIERVHGTPVGSAGRPSGAAIRVEREAHLHEPATAEIHYAPQVFDVAYDRVRWGPIAAGLLTALSALIMLGVLGVAIGLTTIDSNPASGQGGVPADAGRNAAIWAAISGIMLWRAVVPGASSSAPRRTRTSSVAKSSRSSA